MPLLGSALLSPSRPIASSTVDYDSLWPAPDSLFFGSHLGSECSAYNFLFPQARTEFLRKKARHQDSLSELEAAEAGTLSSRPVDLFRELLEEGKGVTRGNKEYEEEKRQEKVSWTCLLHQLSTDRARTNKSMENRWGLNELI